MNVEIGAEAALFPEKEYISGIFFCSVVRDFIFACHLQEKCSGLECETLWTLFLVMMRFLSMAMAVMEKEDMKTPRLGRVFTSLKKGRVACDDFFYISSILG
jgi:hypothetical protein